MSARCFDCFEDFTPTTERFIVLKKLRDLEPMQGEALELARLESLCYDPVEICADCAAWYGDEALSIGEFDDDTIASARLEIAIEKYLSDFGEV